MSHRCPYCRKPFRKSAYLLQHKRDAHPVKYRQEMRGDPNWRPLSSFPLARFQTLAGLDMLLELANALESAP
ncbi:MAG: hypothetical protein P4L76_13355 [Beijerinckiaceae bacterium]|nr:hypothetical protein [Beijerinckiaceae bacterium]